MGVLRRAKKKRSNRFSETREMPGSYLLSRAKRSENAQSSEPEGGIRMAEESYCTRAVSPVGGFGCPDEYAPASQAPVKGLKFAGRAGQDTV